MDTAVDSGLQRPDGRGGGRAPTPAELGTSPKRRAFGLEIGMMSVKTGMTITDFLMACLDEDEALARAASGGPWHVRTVYGLPRLEATERPLGLTGANEEDLHHIVHHHPGRALREVEAKRRIMAEWQKNEERIRENAKKRDDLTRATRRDHAAIKKATTFGWQLHGRRGALSTALTASAEIYSDRPGWREEWRP